MDIASEDRHLAGHVHVSAGGEASGSGLLFVHGLGSNQTGYVQYAERAAAALGATCLTFDLGGHGESTGCRDQLAPANHLTDLVAAYDLLVAQGGVNPDRVGVCGGSYGAYLAAFLTEHRSVSRLLLRAPALYEDDALAIPLARPRSLTADVTAPRLSHALRGFSGKILIVASENDEAIPPGVIDWYASVSKRALHLVVKGARHALVSEAEREVFVQAIIDFFGDM